MKPIIAPSLLAADFGNLQRDLEMINRSEADWLHFDVMDGNFVPNISFGLPICQAVKKHLTIPLDVHLMIEKPERYIEAFAEAGANLISVHLEACNHLHRVIQQIKQAGCRAGVAVNPHTSIHLLSDILSEIDFVNIMSVNPGFGGQKFIERTYQKVRALRALIEDQGQEVLIEIDGGVNQETAPLLLAAGANVLVAGNYVFSSSDPIKTISSLKGLDVGFRFV